MNRTRKALAVACSVLVLAVGAGFATPASAVAVEQVAKASTQKKDLDWHLQGFYTTYDDCYWAGEDGWIHYRWQYFRCPYTWPVYLLMVADD